MSERFAKCAFGDGDKTYTYAVGDGDYAVVHHDRIMMGAGSEPSLPIDLRWCQVGKVYMGSAAEHVVALVKVAASAFEFFG